MAGKFLKFATLAVALGCASSAYAVGSGKPAGSAAMPPAGAHTAQAPRPLAVPNSGAPALNSGVTSAPATVPNASGGCTVGGGPVPKC